MEIMKDYETFLKTSEMDLVCILATTHTCRVCGPIEAKLVEVMKDFPKIPMYKVYLEDVPQFQGQQLIFTVPTIVFFSESKEVLRESRFIDFEKIIRLNENFQ